MNRDSKSKIFHSTLVRDNPEIVYDGFATEKGINSWFTHNSEIDARSGGKLILRWKDFGPDNITDESKCEIIEAVRGKSFIFKWKWEKLAYYTTVEILVEKVKEGTVIRLTEYSYDNSPEGLEALVSCSTGWGEALTLWKFYIEHSLVY